MKFVTNKELFADYSRTAAEELFEKTTYPWEILPMISGFIMKLGPSLPEDEYEKRGDNVWVAKDAVIFDSAYIGGPCIIGHKTEVRQCAFIRGSALVGNGCVVGNSTELKNVILFDGVQVPHYNYVGDSILGYKAHMGAGSITSNIKADKKNILIKSGDEKIETGLRKIGAILGDLTDIGCNSVLNPGSVIGPDTNVYPVSCVRGVVPGGSIYKDAEHIVQRQ